MTGVWTDHPAPNPFLRRRMNIHTHTILKKKKIIDLHLGYITLKQEKQKNK
jgi:hypothetical protein